MTCERAIRLPNDGLLANLRVTITFGRGEPLVEMLPPRPANDCRVFWGTHGCRLERGHDGPHLCDCADEPGVDPITRLYDDGTKNVGAPPYYGPGTNFYGEDA